MNTKIAASILITTLLPCSIFANVNQDLNNFFNSLGYTSNVTDAGAYKGQTAGLYTGGSIFARNSVRNTQVASVQLPSYRAGCGGIDLFTGGFSFINSDNLVQTMENIGNNAVSFAFLLALESMAPVVESTTVILQDWAQKINASNVNSCESAASLVGGVWPKTDMSQKTICETIGSADGTFTDWTAARHGCGIGGQRTNILENAKNDPKYAAYKEMILQNTNIAWSAIQKQDFLANDDELAELFMSLSGTIIIKSGGSDNASNSIDSKPSLAINNNLVKALMHGGSAEIYQCDEYKDCLNVNPAEVTISQDSALGNQVRDMIEIMMDKIRQDEPLDDEEIGFLESTRLPIYKMLTVDVAYSQGGSVLNIADYSEVIAADIVYQYLAESVDTVMIASSQLQLPDEVLHQFREGVQSARNQINEERSQTGQDIQKAIDMVQKTQVLEQQLAGILSSQLAGQIEWANGMR
jgi:conjugative transfer pilus assembly protein TraH